MVGLGNVDNTTDANKPVSTATQTALNLKAPLSNPVFDGIVTHSWCAFRAFGNGTIYRSYGQVSITNASFDTSGGTGIYKITMPEAHPLGVTYGVIGSCTIGSGVSSGSLSITILSNTQFTVYTYNANGVLANTQFTVMTIP